MDLQLQQSITTDERSQAHLALIERLGDLDLSTILVYRIASLVDSAVLAMSWQWDVLNPLLLPDVSQLVTLSYQNWDQIATLDVLQTVDPLTYLAEQEVTEPLSVVRAQYRALILLSTSLHSILGTKAGLQNALTALGYPGAIILEGQHSWGGTSYPSNQGWAVFRVLINLATVPADTDFSALETRMAAICNYWKPARCVLDSIQFQLYLHDTVMPAPYDVLGIFDTIAPLPTDFLVAPAWLLSDSKQINPRYNAEYYFTGVTYGASEPQVADGPLIINGSVVEST